MMEKLYEFAQQNQIEKEKVDELLRVGREKGLSEANLIFFVKSELNKIVRSRNVVEEVVLLTPRKVGLEYTYTIITSNGRVFNIRRKERLEEGVYERRGIGMDAILKYKMPLSKEIKQKIVERFRRISSDDVLNKNFILNEVYLLEAKVVEVNEKVRDEVVYDVICVDKELKLSENIVIFNCLQKIPEFVDVYLLVRFVDLNGELRMFVEGVLVMEIPQIIKL